jgi:iduronate 2-sulfatase
LQHGYQLGDNDQWSKVTCFEHAARIPLIIKPAAGSTTAAAGQRALGIVESVDILPSLVQLAIPGKTIPRCPSTLLASRAAMLCTDGAPNLWTALRQPKSSGNLSAAAYSQIPRDRLVQGMSGAGPTPHETYMGYSIRTDLWRYTEWHPFDPDTGEYVVYSLVVRSR